MSTSNPEPLTADALRPSASPAPQPLPDEWRQWLALNLARGAAETDLIQVLVNEGFPEIKVRLEVELAASHPYVMAAKSLASQIKKRDWVLDSLSIMKESSQDYGRVPRHRHLSRDEFFENYYYQNRPVIISGVLDHWPALTRWTPEYLKSRCGERMVEVQFDRDTDPEYEINCEHHKKLMPFSEYVDRVHQPEETNNFYMTANNSGINGAALRDLWEDVPVLTEYLDASDPHAGFFWYGPKGTVTPLHHDLTNNFMAQVRGRKRIRMIPPTRLPQIYNFRHCFSQIDLANIDYERFPDFRNVPILDFMLEAGDLLFLPVGYWHHVTGMEISITMTYTNFLRFNHFGSFYTTYDHFY